MPKLKTAKTTVLGIGLLAIAIALCIDFEQHAGGHSPVEVSSHSLSSSASSFTRRWLSEGTTESPGEEHSSEESHETEEHEDTGLLFAVLMIGMGVVLQQILLSVGNYFPLPYTVALVIIGGVFGAVNSVGYCDFDFSDELHHESEAIANATNATEYPVTSGVSETNCSALAPADCKSSEGCLFVSTLPASLGNLGSSIDVWAHVDPNFLLYFFIPALVYASAHTVDVHIFRESFINVLSLAIPGVLLATYLMYFFFFNVYAENDRYAWSFDACMIFGSILSATDPVAVVALLDDLGAPHKLSIAIEGESLLNDGTALVLYTIFKTGLLERTDPIGDQFLFFFRLALGGFGAGVVVGIITVFMLQFMSSSLLETTWTVGVAYLTFFMCENHNIHFSGVIGVVFLGVTVSLFGQTRLTSPEFMEHFWSMWNFIANTLIFSVAGVIIAESIFFEEHVEPEDWGTLFVVYFVQLLIRAVVIVVLSPILYFSGKRHGYELGWKELILLWWSGLRGAVGLILALELGLADPNAIVEREVAQCTTASGTADCDDTWYLIGSGSVKDAERFQALLTFFVAGFATLTLLINGVTTRFVVAALGLTHKTVADKYSYDAASRHLEEKTMAEIEDRLKHDDLYRYADWKKVWSSIPIHTYDSLHWRQQLSLIDDDDEVKKQEKQLAKKEARMYEMQRVEDLDTQESSIFEEVLELYADVRQCIKKAQAADTQAHNAFHLRRQKQQRGSVKGLAWSAGASRGFTLDVALENDEEMIVDFYKRHWGILQELRLRFLMLVQADYWQQFRDGYLGRDTVRDLAEVCRISLDRTTRDRDVKFSGAEHCATLKELRKFEIKDWITLKHKIQRANKRQRCCGSVFRRWCRQSCNNVYAFGVALRVSGTVDALYGYLTAHRHVLHEFRERYWHAMHKLDDILDHGNDVAKCSRSFLGNQVVEDHPLLIHKVITEVEAHMDSAMAMMATESIDPKTIATHQAVMHLLHMQKHEIHHMMQHGLINHEEETELISAVVTKKAQMDRIDLGASINTVQQAKLDLLSKAISLGDGDHFAKHLANLAILHDYERGEALFSQGEATHRGCYIILQGSVKIVFESDQSRDQHRREAREKRLLAARARAARLSSGRVIGSIQTARNAAAGQLSPSHQATQSSLSVLSKLSHMDDDHGPRNLHQKIKAGGARQVGALRTPNSTTCLFGVLSTLTRHERYTKAIAVTPVLAFFLPGSNFTKLMKRFSEQRVNTDTSSDSDDDDDRSPVWPKSARSPLKQPAAPSPQELVEIGIDVEQPSQNRVSTAVPRLSEGMAPDDSEDKGIGLHRMVSAPESVAQARSLTAPRAGDTKQAPSLGDIFGRKGDSERKDEFPLPPAAQEDHAATRPRGGSADFDSKRSPQGLRPRAGSDGELAASSPMHVERHGSADDLFGDNVHVSTREEIQRKPRASRVQRPSMFQEFKNMRKGAARGNLRARPSVYKIDFATFLESSQFETRLLQTAAADAIELFFTALDIIYDHKWVEYNGRIPSRPLRSQDVVNFKLLEGSNGVMLDTLGILLEGRASVGPERSITTDEVMLVFGSPQKPIPIDLHPCKGKIFRTPARMILVPESVRQRLSQMLFQFEVGKPTGEFIPSLSSSYQAYSLPLVADTAKLHRIAEKISDPRMLRLVRQATQKAAEDRADSTSGPGISATATVISGLVRAAHNAENKLEESEEHEASIPSSLTEGTGGGTAPQPNSDPTAVDMTATKVDPETIDVPTTH